MSIKCLDSVDKNILSPGNDTWRPAGQLSFARYQHCGVVTGDGSVVITGGQEGRGKYGAAVDTVERYPAWHESVDMSTIPPVPGTGGAGACRSGCPVCSRPAGRTPAGWCGWPGGRP